MKHTITRPIVLAASLWMAATHAPAQTTATSDRPSLKGSWQYRPSETGCAEQYFFRSDGTLMVQSAHEISESTYVLADQPERGGFYKFETQVTQTNGRHDCQGKQTPVGKQSSSYLRFQANGNRLILCREANLSACMGPLVRLKGRIGA